MQPERRVETAEARRFFGERWGALAGTLYLPRVPWHKAGFELFALRLGEAMVSQPRLCGTRLTFVSSRVVALRHLMRSEGLLRPLGVTEGGRLEPRPLSQQELVEVMGLTTTVLVDVPVWSVPFPQRRLWLLRDWEDECPAELRAFGSQFPTAEVVDYAGLVSWRHTTHVVEEVSVEDLEPRDDGGGAAAPRGRLVRHIMLRDRLASEDVRAATRSGREYTLAHPFAVAERRAEGASVLLQGDLLSDDPFGWWLLFPGKGWTE